MSTATRPQPETTGTDSADRLPFKVKAFDLLAAGRREEAQELAEEGKAIVDLSGGLHASEVAGAQHIITLAHQIVNEADSKKFKPILDDVILVLWPSLTPDGQDIIANWYMSNVGTPYETARTP